MRPIQNAAARTLAGAKILDAGRNLRPDLIDLPCNLVGGRWDLRVTRVCTPNTSKALGPDVRLPLHTSPIDMDLLAFTLHRISILVSIIAIPIAGITPALESGSARRLTNPGSLSSTKPL